MLKLSLLATLCLAFCSFGQNHAENFEAINTQQEAEEYAAGFREVFTGTVNYESDVFFFDDIDTSKLETYVGTSKSFFGKTTKLLDDSLMNIVKVQVILFDLKNIDAETAEILLGQMKKLLERGDSYWDLRERFSHTSAQFSTSPELAEEVSSEYKVAVAEMTEGSYHEWRSTERLGIVIIEDEPHLVPGFVTISFINMNNGNIR